MVPNQCNLFRPRMHSYAIIYIIINDENDDDDDDKTLFISGNHVITNDF